MVNICCFVISSANSNVLGLETGAEGNSKTPEKCTLGTSFPCLSCSTEERFWSFLRVEEMELFLFLQG
jgi:hypothetical protein